MRYYWPVLLIVGANTVYHIAAKGTSQTANAFVSLAITYLIGAAACLAIFFLTSSAKTFPAELKTLNWATVVLGVAIVGLEVGNIFLYRAGWNISVGSLVSNIALAVVLLVVGALFYRERITIWQLGGIALCIVGLLLIHHE